MRSSNAQSKLPFAQSDTQRIHLVPRAPNSAYRQFLSDADAAPSAGKRPPSRVVALAQTVGASLLRNLPRL